jgi:hypothetical protein
MAPFAVVAIVAAGLFGTGTVIKDKEPVVGQVLQGAAVGALAGGALGAATGTAAGTANVLNAARGVSTITSASLIGGGLGATIGGWFAPAKK